MQTLTIDTQYTGHAGVAAAYLVHDGTTAAFVETNTSAAVPLLMQALETADLGPSDVAFVVITHIHLDHAGGAGALMKRCPEATLLAHPRAAPHAIDPSRIVAGATAVYGEAKFHELYGTVEPIPADRVRAIEDDTTVALGSETLRFLHTRGHANHHFCVLDEDAGAMFTGDSFGILYPHLQRNGLFAFPSTSPTDFDPEAAHAAIDRIVQTGATAVYPTHFGGYSRIGEIADQLHRMLDGHAALLESADQQDLEGDALAAHCSEGVTALFESQLLLNGLASDALARRLIALDIDLNGQGIAAALQKRRYKRGLTR